MDKRFEWALNKRETQIANKFLKRCLTLSITKWLYIRTKRITQESDRVKISVKISSVGEVVGQGKLSSSTGGRVNGYKSEFPFGIAWQSRICAYIMIH